LIDAKRRKNLYNPQIIRNFALDDSSGIEHY